MKSGDVITDFDGQPVDRGTRLQWLASIAGVGKTVDVKVARLGSPQDIKVTLGRLDDVEPKPANPFDPLH